MGSYVELNDTLQITREQGFPEALDLEVHLKTPYKLEDFEGQVFSFKEKPAIRLYHAPPVRNFLVENRDGKWIHWGQVFVLSTSCDYEAKTTSGTFKIIHLYSPEEMKMISKVVDRRPEFDYFD